ncbi:MAG: hypothetical protein WD749_01185 [Phycisphaerales bacterium]
MGLFRRAPDRVEHARVRRRWPLVPLALAGAVFGGLLLYMRAVERGAIRSVLIDDAEAARPVAGVAQSIRAMKLVTVEVNTSVTSDSADDSWRGLVQAKVTAPVRLLYGADLSRLSASSVAFSPLEKSWLVRIPRPQRIATEVCTDSEQVEVEVGWMRLRSRAGEYYLGLARRDLSALAREIRLSDEDARFVHATTREQVEALLRKLIGSEARVRVEFDDMLAPADPAAATREVAVHESESPAAAPAPPGAPGGSP